MGRLDHPGRGQDLSSSRTTPWSIEVSRSTIDRLKGRFDLISTTHPSSVLRAKTDRVVCLSAAESCTSGLVDRRGFTGAKGGAGSTGCRFDRSAQGDQAEHGCLPWFFHA